MIYFCVVKYSIFVPFVSAKSITEKSTTFILYSNLAHYLNVHFYIRLDQNKINFKLDFNKSFYILPTLMIITSSLI